MFTSKSFPRHPSTRGLLESFHPTLLFDKPKMPVLSKLTPVSANVCRDFVL